MTDPEPLDFEGWRKPVTVEMTFANVDPGVLELLTGVRADGSEPVKQAMEVWANIPWHWRQWQWWLQRTPWRRPKRRRYYFLPNVKIELPQVSRNQKESE